MIGPWADHAACAGMDPNVFHPDQGDNAGGKRAKLICAGCPVRIQCLNHALAARERHGVWGGANIRDRERIRAARQAKAAS